MDSPELYVASSVGDPGGSGEHLTPDRLHVDLRAQRAGRDPLDDSHSHIAVTSGNGRPTAMPHARSMASTRAGSSSSHCAHPTARALLRTGVGTSITSARRRS